jgi:hypothetical protein
MHENITGPVSSEPDLPGEKDRPGSVIPLRLQRKRRVRFAYQLIWIKDTRNRGPERNFTVRRAGGTADIDLRMEAPVRWKLVADGRGVRRIPVWPAGPPTAVQIRVPRVTPVPGTLVSGLKALVPEGPASDQEPLSKFAQVILANTGAAIGRAMRVALASAWEQAGESNPLLEFRVSPGEPIHAALRRIGDPTYVGEGRPVFERALFVNFDLPVRLPVLNRAAARSWRDILEKAVLEFDLEGGISFSLDPMEVDSLGGLLLTGGYLSLGTTNPPAFPVIFRHHQQNSLGRTCVTLPPLLERYGLDQPVAEWLRARKGEISTSIQISLPGTAACCWYRAPRDKQAIYYDQMSRVSQAIHTTLRHWVAYLYLQDFSLLEDHHASHAVLAFSELRPFRGKVRSEFSYDVMNPDPLQKALRMVTRPLTERFVEIRRRLDDEGRQLVMPHYTVRRALHVSRALQRLPKEFGGLIQAEQQIIGGFLDLANRAATLRAHPESVFPIGTSLMEQMQVRLRRICSHPSFPALAPLVLIEATQALAVEQGKKFPLRAIVKMRAEDTGDECVFLNETSPTE